MPTIVQGGNNRKILGNGSLLATDYSYKYPGIHLKPGTLVHDRIVAEVLSRAQASHDAFVDRHKSWRKVDNSLTSYVKLDESEKALKTKDVRKPVSVVVPVSYATLDTLLTYWTTVFLDSPILRYEPRNSEDVIGAALLEKVVELQTIRGKAGLAIHTFGRDAFSYGFGVLAPTWVKKMGTKTVRDNGFLSGMSRLIGLAGKKISQPTTLYEGHEFSAIDPYMYLPDPNVSITDIQKGGYVGFMDRTDYLTMLSEEAESENGIFNVQYLKHTDGKCQLLGDSRGSVSDGRHMPINGTQDVANIDRIYMYINIIPSEWGLSNYNYPEKWLFCVASDSVVTMASPSDLDHDMYPFAVCAPEFDGRSLSPISNLEVVHPLQETVDWLFSSHMANVRKAINDMLIVDPSLINIHDLRDPEPGKLIRMRKAAWGRGVNDAVKQLTVNDITRGNVADAMTVMDIINRVTGAVDGLQGIMRSGGERRSATEARGTRESAMSRLARFARIAGMQAIQDLGYIVAMQTQQLMSEELYVKIVGRYEEDLKAEYGDKTPLVRPTDILVDFDMVMQDGSIPSSENLDSWVQMYQILATNPLLSQKFDMVRIFKHISRLMGAKNINDFVASGGNIQTQVLPDAQVEAQAQAGNLMPMGGMNGAISQ